MVGMTGRVEMETVPINGRLGKVEAAHGRAAMVVLREMVQGLAPERCSGSSWEMVVFRSGQGGRSFISCFVKQFPF